MGSESAPVESRRQTKLPSSLADLNLGVDQWQDPWGGIYQFVNLEKDTAADQARTDYGHSAVNRDYDLYSMGKDGRSATTFSSPAARDDVVRGLSGSYYGTVADYPQAPNQ